MCFHGSNCRHQASTVVSDRQSAFRTVLILGINGGFRVAKNWETCIGYCQEPTHRALATTSASSQHYECYYVATKRHSAALSDAGLDSSARPCCRGGHMPGGYGKSAFSPTMLARDFRLRGSDRNAYLRSCMCPCFSRMTYLNWPLTLLLGSGRRSRAGRSCLATGISHRYTEKSDRRPDIPRNRYRFSPPGWWLGTPRCRMYRSLWIYLTI